MTLIEAQIADIKNLNTIYIFTTDSILKDNSKYIGAKVLYDKDKIFSLDYKSEYFESFIKKILVRYNKEKNKRNIILLGDLTKKLVQDSFFTILEDKKEFKQTSGILVNNKKNQVKLYEAYLEKAIQVILKGLYNYEYVKVKKIDGFNYKYVVTYNCPSERQLYMLIFIKEDGNLDFRISNIDKNNVNISGTIIDKFNSIEINWYESNQNIKGIVTLNIKDKLITERVYKEDEPYYFKENEDTLLDEDEEIINFYTELFGIKKLSNVMKVADCNYLLSDSNVLVENDEGIFYNNTQVQISLLDEDVIIKEKIKNGISKYNDEIKVTLDEEINEYTLKQLEIDSKFYILIQKRTKKNNSNTYSYEVLKLDSEKNIFMPFEIEDRYEIKEELKSLELAKQYIKGGKRK